MIDDEEESARTYGRALGQLRDPALPFEIEPYLVKDFRSQLEIVAKREEGIRSGKKVSFDDSDFDRAAAVIVDFELPKAFEALGNPTGERICYLLRCYSSCGTLVGVDQFITLGTSSFDLTLRGHPGSFADVNVTASQLTLSGLWGGRSDFRPWYWPNVIQLPARLEAATDLLRSALDRPLSEVLGIPELIRNVSDAARDFLGSKPEDVTPRSFVQSSGNGIQGRTETATDEMVARISAARLMKWFERLVLPGEDVLMDGPHMAVRYPSLLAASDRTSTESWNVTAAFKPHDQLGLRWEAIENHRVNDSPFLSRPSWLASNMARDKKVNEVADPFSRTPSPFVFAEDASAFFAEGECHPFKASFDSPYVRRYVKQIDGVTYTPIDNLEM